MLLESPSNWRDYELIDSGDFEKLERFGNYYLIRPEPKALWGRTLPTKEWMSMAHTRFTTGAGFGSSGKEDSGSWNMLKKMDEQWMISYNRPEYSFKLRLGLTAFKHVGVFPEQAPNWDYIYAKTREVGNATPGVKPKILNLFAYTGAASLAANCGGGNVTHLDSVKQVVNWARVNMELSKLDNIRWVIEDALKFVQREARRGNIYQGIILDPPAYGHGPDGERWKLDELLFELLVEVSKILAPKDSFVVLNLYSNGYSAVLADTLIKTSFKLNASAKSVTNEPAKGATGYPAQGVTTQSGKTDGYKKDIELTFGELVLRDKFEKALPLSVFTRLKR